MAPSFRARKMPRLSLPLSSKLKVADDETPPSFPEPATRLIAEYVSKRVVCNMRLVCKGWQKSVDEMIQQAPLDGSPLISNDGYILKNIFQQRFSTRLQIEQFLNATEASVENPFPGRSIMLYLNEIDWYAVKLLLWRFGTQIWHLQISSDMDGTAVWKYMEENLSNIRHAFMYLFNLKTLVINGLNMHGDGDLANIRIMEDLDSNPFPNLENLEEFNAENSSAPLVVNRIIKASMNMKRLIVSKHEFDNGMVSPKLESLKFKINGISDFYSLKNLKCPVRTLELLYSQDCETPRPSLILVNWLKGLKQYAKTVEIIDLLVDVTPVKIGDPMGKWVTFNFLRLETLNIEYYPESSLSFIPTLTGLKNLLVSTIEDEDGEKIREELSDTNYDIWKRMPKLQYIQHDDLEEMDDPEKQPKKTIAKREWDSVRD